jgi:NTE family protein
VDGGITDNLGLRALYEVIEIAGGIEEFTRKYQRVPPRRLVLVSVNASTDPEPEMDRTNRQPSLRETVNAMSDVQLHRYNTATIELMRTSLDRWAQALSTPDRPVEDYFILLDFEGIQQEERRRFFNRMPTSFSLTDEQVDGLIAAGRELLRNNPEFRRLLADMGADQQGKGARPAADAVSRPAQE